MENDLNNKQILFCHEYLKDFNATKAAIRAGYSEKSSRNIASENLAKPNIRKYISKISGELYQSIGLNSERVVHEITSIAFDLDNPVNTRMKALEALLGRLNNETTTVSTFFSREQSAKKIHKILESITNKVS